MELEDEADGAVAELGQLAGVQCAEIRSGQVDAARSGPIQGTHQVKKRRLAHAGLAQHGDHCAAAQLADDVVVADLGTGVPLDDNEVDVVVCSLSLMGANSGDYIREAARVLVFDGRLIICESTSRLPNDSVIRERLKRLGFNVTNISTEAQFTFIQALRTDVEPAVEGSLN